MWQRQWSKCSVDFRAIRHSLEHQQTMTIPRSSAAAMVNFLDWNCDYVRSLENRLTAMAAQADQDRHSVGKRVDDLLEDSKKLLMLPFSTIADGFPKLVRDNLPRSGEGSGNHRSRRRR